MSQGRAAAEWAREAASMSLLANCNRDPEKRRRPFSPDDFNPTVDRSRTVARRRRGGIRLTTANIKILKGMCEGGS